MSKGQPPATLESFSAELSRLVATFEKNFAHYHKPDYDEASLRQEFLNPLFSALGWDVENKAGLIPSKREVEVESRTRIAGRQKRADYLFRTDGNKRFMCEAKKPAIRLNSGDAFQAKRYGYNIPVPLALLTHFEEMKIYVVGGKPHPDEPEAGEWKTWHYKQYPLIAQEMWNLLSREKVAGGAIDAALEALPKRKPTGKGKAKQQWLIKPDRTRALDHDFLGDLDEARRELASDLYKHNDHAALLEGNTLNDAVQRIIDRILFLRICEDRDIDTGTTLHTIVETWRKNYGHDEPRQARQESLRLREDSTFDLDDDARGGGGGTGGRIEAPRESLWYAIVRHFRALDRRPPSHVPFFNGNLFKPHGSEKLLVGDEWLAGFIDELSSDETAYLFNIISVEILGSVYERFLGKVVRPHGKGITVEEKPEVRKAGGVYYTPSYIVDYIVEQTVGRLAEGVAPEKTLGLRILDPACGSGSFLIRAFERMCEHWQEWFTEKADRRKRKWCWVDKDTGDVHLTVALKREILTANIYGVDIDAQAVEVSQLSLYLKMLEGENRTTLERERELFADEVALLPPLQDNIKCGNSLIASDFSMMSEDLVRVNAFDWEIGFREIMKAGGFDAVIGNPPYIRIQTMQESDPESVEYLNTHYAAAAKGNYDIYVVFVERVLGLLNENGQFGYILPHKFFNAQYGESLRAKLSAGKHLRHIVHFGDQQIFEGATTYTCLLFLSKRVTAKCSVEKVTDLDAWRESGTATRGDIKTASLSGTEWNFNVGPDALLMQRLAAMPTLGMIAARMGQGIRTSANEVYVLDVVDENSRTFTAYSEILQRNVKLDRGSVLRFLQGREIKSYILLHSGKVVIMPYRLEEGRAELIAEKELADLFPQTYEYLRENKAYLSSRERGRMKGAGWYGYIYPKNIDIMQAAKILVPDIADRACYGFDVEGDYAFTSGYGITLKSDVKASPLFVLGLLNSGLLSFYIKRISTPMRGGFFRYFTQFIEKLPILIPDRARHDKLVMLVEKMLALTPKLRAAKTEAEKATLQNAVSKTDHDIDALVYDLYALTPEEVALVEGGK